MRKCVHLSVLFFLICLNLISSVYAAQPLKIGVSPNGEDSVALAEIWIPFLQQLEKQSGVKLRFATAPDLLEFNRRVADGDYDLIITNKYLYTIFSHKHNLSYLAELYRSSKRFAVALIVPQKITQIQSLQGTLIAVKRDEDSGQIRALDTFLNENNVTAIRDNLPTYDKIFESVSEQLHMGGIVPVDQLKNYKYPYNILWQTDNRNSSVLSTPKNIDNAQIKQIIASLKKLKNTSPTPKNGSEVLVSVMPALSH